MIIFLTPGHFLLEGVGVGVGDAGARWWERQRENRRIKKVDGEFATEAAKGVHTRKTPIPYLI